MSRNTNNSDQRRTITGDDKDWVVLVGCFAVLLVSVAAGLPLKIWVGRLSPFYMRLGLCMLPVWILMFTLMVVHSFLGHRRTGRFDDCTVYAALAGAGWFITNLLLYQPGELGI